MDTESRERKEKMSSAEERAARRARRELLLDAIRAVSTLGFFCFGFFTSHYFFGDMQSTWELIAGIGSLIVSVTLLTVFSLLTYKFAKRH